MERIHVAVRARPLSPEEAKTSPWRISDNSIFFSNPPSAKFDFDKIFGEECKTVDVYNARTKDIVSAAVQGFNGTVFAYGQTSSGKTHTMRGSSSEPGVIPLAVHDLFNFIQEAVDREFLLRMSYMEIYNEEINDLLAPEHWRLQIHESIERGIFVAGLREEIVASPEQVLELMEFGEFHRHTGETNMNLHSSRSHTIFRMIIESRQKAEHTPADNSCDAVRVSALNLVDLAGSERAAKTGAEGVRLKEGSHINKSLMTLGTVIKKLSEGAESQGGHVPYRDSKLTRILQPALGGNANTAIICNITLAQIHADETKSSLQFASRALRVTNSVHVNEIMTDAALLKRQKKEIEELRAKLQASPSEHLEEEILNLRNTLLKSELERERIALELEEEKKAQAERDKRLQEQEKKIENLSTMVLCSNRDESRDVYKKDKRRDTWCPGNLSRMNSKELCSTVKGDLSAVRPIRAGLDPEPLLPFEELFVPDSVDNSSNQEGDFMNMLSEDCSVPDQQALVHVTNRRKGAPRKKSLQTEDRRSVDMQSEYEELLLEFEAHKTVSEIQIDYLTRKIAGVEADLIEKCNDSSMQYNNDTIHLMGNKYLMEPEAILVIKQLHEKIRVLEMERSSNQESLDSVVELATEQTISAREKYEEEAKEAKEQLASVQFAEEKNFMSQVLAEVQGMMIEVENSRNLTDSVIPVMDDLLQSYSVISNSLAELKSFLPESSMQIKSIISNQEKISSCSSVKINELEDEKIQLHNQNLDLQVQIEQLQKVVHSSENALVEYSEKYEAEKFELLSQIRSLQKEISSLTSSSLAREKESLRKDLEKTKAKLKDTESKLKNAIQEKTKLEGEKAYAEREIQILHGQKAILERDINKHDSIVGRRRDSVVDRSSSVFEAKRAKGAAFLAEQTMQEEYKKLKVLAFEMETTIASLEEQLTIANEEKEEAESRAGSLASDIQTLSDELNASNAELSVLQEGVLDLKSRLEESKSHHQGLENTINTLSEEKEDLAMQLADALLAIEEEKAIWLAKERASVEAIEEKTNVYNAEIASLSEAMTKMRNELENYREECKLLKESLTNSERCTALEKDCSKEKSLEIDQMRIDLRVAEEHNTKIQEALKSQLEAISSEHSSTIEEVEKLRMELSMLSKERESLLARIRDLDSRPISNHDLQNSELQAEQLRNRLASLEVKMHSDEVNNNKARAKLRMRLHGTHTKLEAFRDRYRELVDEKEFMNKKFEAASKELKQRLASCGHEILNLKKQLAAHKS
nr:kinesin-like protein KIN-7O isoform X1 [Ipomoea batatas]